MNKQKIVLGLVNILFLIFEKGNKQKNCVRYFEIRKYAFLIFEKVKNCARICKYSFLIFEKGNKQKRVPGILGFVSMLF